MARFLCLKGSRWRLQEDRLERDRLGGRRTCWEPVGEFRKITAASTEVQSWHWGDPGGVGEQFAERIMSKTW